MCKAWHQYSERSLNWPLKEFFEKIDFENNQQTTINREKITQHAELRAMDTLYLVILGVEG